MFSRKTVMVAGVIALIAINIIALSVASDKYPFLGIGRLTFSIVSPIQAGVTGTIRFLERQWERYFFLVSVSAENEKLIKELGAAKERLNHYQETLLANRRLQNLLEFRSEVAGYEVAAQVIGRGTSPWFQSVFIDKGRNAGLEKGMPVVVSEGVVGQIVGVAPGYARVMLIIDQNSGLDALVQRTRARGIVQGKSDGQCLFKYVLRKEDVRVGDTVISSGLDHVFPKGVRVGRISGVVKRNSGIFQEVTLVPYVDFEKLEEVLVLMVPSSELELATP
jgi:rod shape-determining protein MreC